jgi:hypothetical protein
MAGQFLSSVESGRDGCNRNRIFSARFVQITEIATHLFEALVVLLGVTAVEEMRIAAVGILHPQRLFDGTPAGE